MTSKQRVALITGCGAPSGIGSCIALELANRGYRVFATARRIEQMAHLMGTCELLSLDVTAQESIEAAVSVVRSQTGGRLSVLVNNAGIDGWAPTLDTDLPKFRSLLETNLLGPLALIQACAPMLVDTADSSDRKSVILNIGSFVVHGMGWKGAYSASKAAFGVMSDVLRIEMENLGVRVITCETGAVMTPMFDAHPLVLSPMPSGYYPNFPSILKKIAEAFDSAMTSKEAGRQLAKIVDASNPPRKVWVGSFAYTFAWIMPLVPTWVKDSVWRKTNFTGEVMVPAKVK